MENKNTLKLNTSQKVLITFWIILLYILISSKFMYLATNKVLNTIKNNSPTFLGYILHLILFAVIVYLSLTHIPVPNI